MKKSLVRGLSVLALVISHHAQAVDLTVPSKAYPTVQSAVNAAVDGDRVLVAAGVYNERVDVQQKAIEIVGAGAALTRFVAQTPGSEVFRLLGPTSAPVALRALAVEGAVHGAVAASTSVSISNCRFASCRKPVRGGAIEVWEFATANITDCEFVGNSTEAWGGAIRMWGGQTIVERCTFSANEVVGSAITVLGGGAVSVSQGALTLRDSSFQGDRVFTNVAANAALGDGGSFTVEARGGAILMESTVSPNSLVIENCTFRNNRAESRITIANSGKAVWQTGSVARGGAVYLSGTVPATLRNVLVEDCLALGTGSGSPDGQSYVICSSFAGAIGLENAAYHTIEDVTIRRCEGRAELLGGAGAEGQNVSGGMLVNNGSLTRVTIEDCKTTRGSGMGGGLHMNVWDWTGTTGTVTATDLTIRRCSSFDGGGAWIRGNSVIVRGTFEENLAKSGVGGGVYARATTAAEHAPSFVDCLIRLNSATAGGGVFLRGSGMKPSLTGVNFEQNIGSTDGGALYALEGARASLTGCRACGNTVPVVVGGYDEPGLNWMTDDCNTDGICDADQLSSGALSDDDADGIPDACQDCDGDGESDRYAIAQGWVPDCNGNQIPDSCDIAAGGADCNGNGIPDSCDVTSAAFDCDGNGAVDTCETSQGSASDCLRHRGGP